MKDEELKKGKTSFTPNESCRPQIEAIQFLEKLKWNRTSFLEGCKSRQPTIEELEKNLKTSEELLEKCIKRMISDSAQYHDIELGMFSSEIEDSLNELKGINTDPHYNRYEEGKS